ncbi:MAG: ATP-binding protein, partial [Gaiellaceae bacterium]
LAAQLASADANAPHRFELRPGDSTPQILVMTSRAIVDHTGAPDGWAGTLTDVTAEAGAEASMASARDKATEASRLKSNFLTHMSHEIRTPMNGVIGMIEMLLDTDLDDSQRAQIETVRDSGEALLAVINNILDFSKIEAGMSELEHTDFSLQTVVEDVVDLLIVSARAKGLRLQTAIGTSMPAVVRGDAGRLRQVLVNLVGNAVKFTEAGEVVVRIVAAETIGAETFVRFEVSDTGDGIAADKLELIFQPFVQADSSTSRKYGGTGLGLAISSELVALMGGECGATSVRGAGSTFWFTVRVHAVTVPLPQTVDRAPVQPDTAVLAASAQPHGRRLLLAEDNLINQKVAVAMLSGAGYHVDTVLDGAAAVEAFAAHSYDAILMDCQMPELNGFEATAAIRAREGGGRRIPIIAMTAGAFSEDRELCLDSGMDDYLSKPVRRAELLAVVAQSVGDSGP